MLRNFFHNHLLAIPVMTIAIQIWSIGTFAGTPEIRGSGALSSVFSEQHLPASNQTAESDPFTFLLFPSVEYDFGGATPAQVLAGDVNKDGHLDLVVLTDLNVFGGGGIASVFLGTGDGTFQSGVSYSTGGYGADSGALADVNGDGKLDLIVSNCGMSSNSCTDEGSIGVLLNNGDGTFRPVVSYIFGWNMARPSMAVADLNSDGKPDVVVTALCWYYTCPGQMVVNVLFGNGDGSFQPPVIYPISVYGVSSDTRQSTVAVADVPN